jgi:hypothetical protein
VIIAFLPKRNNIWGSLSAAPSPALLAHLSLIRLANIGRNHFRNVHHHLVDVTCGSFQKVTEGVNPYSGAYGGED